MHVPTEWGMFTSGGNRQLTNAARTVVKKAEKAAGDSRKIHNALVAFVAVWERMSRRERTGEAGDTAVREVVAYFVEDVWRNYVNDDVWDLWEEVRDAAYDRVKKES